MDPLSQASKMKSEEEEEEANLLLDKVVPPIHLKESAGDRSCCIYRIPHTLQRVNDKAYAPKIVSIGPYHHSRDNKHLNMIEEHKKLYLEIFVSKTKENGVYLSHLVEAVSRLEQKIRNSYSERLEFSQQKLVKVMILDGCFILMLFLVVSGKITYTNLKDPIFKLRWILPTLRSDLLLLENQVPLFLLEALFETSKLAPSNTLKMLAFKFFNYSIERSEGFWEKQNDLKAKHLLDLIRMTFIPVQTTPTTPRQCCINIFTGSRPGESSRTETAESSRTETAESSRTETSKTICLSKISCFKERNDPEPGEISRKKTRESSRTETSKTICLSKISCFKERNGPEPGESSRTMTSKTTCLSKISCFKERNGPEPGETSRTKTGEKERTKAGEKERTETSKTTCLSKISCLKERSGVQRSLPPPRLILSARKLQLRGIKFKRRENVETPLDISFKNGLVEIPLLVFDDFISSFLINCVAFEQFNNRCSTEITSYVVFMGCLINTEEDATLLAEKGIIENYFGTGEEVSLFFKNIGKDISFDISKSFLSKVFEGVNKYTSQGYHVQWAGFKYTHFNTPWTFLSSFAALMLLILTIFQAFFAAFAYFRPPKNN